MANLYVARHGETDYNKEGRYLGRIDISLNQTGIAQAEELARKAKNLNIDVIYSSPLKRAIETAEIIRLKNNCGIIIDDRFAERSIGVYEGLTKEEAKEKYPDLYERNITRIFDEAPLGGETIDRAAKRVFDGLDDITREGKYSKIMIVTHGFAAKAINKYFNPQISDQDFFGFKLGNAEIKEYRF